MATVAATTDTKSPFVESRNVSLVRWTGLGNADQGEATELTNKADRTIQVFGTWGSATLVVEGSLDGVNYETLTDPQGNLLSFTTNRIETVTEAVRYIRPRTSGGTGTDVTAILLSRGVPG